MNYRIAMLNFLGLMFYSLVPAQNRVVDYHYNSWYMYFGSHFLTNKIGLHSEYQWRRNDIIRNWQQSLTRLGIIYTFNPSLSITLGYGHVLTYPYGKQPIPTMSLEHRLWQQALLNQEIHKWNFKHRYRFEQRWLQTISSWRYLNRFRYQLWLEKTIYTAEKFKIFFSLYDEIFINFAKNVEKNLLDQNRLYAAIGWTIRNHTIIRLGYLNQIIAKADGIHEEINHTLQISLHYHYKLKRKN